MLLVVEFLLERSVALNRTAPDLMLAKPNYTQSEAAVCATAQKKEG